MLSLTEDQVDWHQENSCKQQHGAGGCNFAAVFLQELYAGVQLAPANYLRLFTHCSWIETMPWPYGCLYGLEGSSLHGGFRSSTGRCLGRCFTSGTVVRPEWGPAQRSNRQRYRSCDSLVPTSLPRFAAEIGCMHMISPIAAAAVMNSRRTRFEVSHCDRAHAFAGLRISKQATQESSALVGSELLRRCYIAAAYMQLLGIYIDFCRCSRCVSAAYLAKQRRVTCQTAPTVVSG